MWDLQQNAGTVAVFAHFGTTVTHIFEHCKCIFYKLVGFPSVDVDYHPDATAIVFPAALIKTIFYHTHVSFYRFCRKSKQLESTGIGLGRLNIYINDTIGNLLSDKEINQ